jgi:hypothetical protein
MTFVGKLLVIIQLVLSFCFMALAGAIYVRQDAWRDVAQECQERVANTERDMETEKKTLNDKITLLTGENKILAARAADFEGQFNAEKVKVEQHEIAIDTLKTELNTEKSLASISGSEATLRRQESLNLRRINEDLKVALNGQNANVGQLEDSVFNLDIENKALKERYTEQLKILSTYRRVMAANGLDTDPSKYDRAAAPVPVVAGRVLETRKSPNGGRERVEISIGSDDGVDVGTPLFIYRIGDRNRYLGEIKLELVTPDRSVGVVVNRAKNGVIERFDHVSTKL